MQILNNHSVMFSSCMAFNDPFDCAVYLDGNATIEEWHTYLSMQSMPPLLRAQTEMNILKDPQKAAIELEKGYWDSVMEMGIFCLSEAPDIILLWSHYADFHKGVCLRFDILKDMDTFLSPIKVDYNNEYPRVKYISQYINNDPNLADALWHKAKDWEYEKEYRVIKPNFKGLKEFRKEAMTGIIFGCCCPDETKREITEKLNEKGFTGVELFEAIRSETAYQLNLNSIGEGDFKQG